MEDLKKVLVQLDMQEYEERFSDEGIYTFNCLYDLDSSMMRELVPKIGSRSRLTKHLNTYKTQQENVPAQDINHNYQYNPSVVTSENLIDDCNGLLIPDPNDLSTFSDKCEDNLAHVSGLHSNKNVELTQHCVLAQSSPKFHGNADTTHEVFTEFSDEHQDKTHCTRHPENVATKISRMPCGDSVNFDERPAKVARVEKGAVFKNNKIVHEFLASSKIGLALIEVYNRKQTLDSGKPTFNQAERRRLVHLIIDGCLESDRELKTRDLAYVAEDIEKLFPNECKGAYYLPPSECKKNANGKLVNFYFNSKRILKKGKAAVKTQSSSRFLDDSEETKENVIWLKNNKHPWLKVEELWDGTRGFRLQASEEGGTVHDYFKQWPILQEEVGYRLLDADFNARYSNREMCLIGTWDILGAQLWEQCIATKNKLLTINGCFDEMNNNCDLRDALLLRSLPTIFPPTLHRTKNSSWRPSLAECQDAYILFVKEEKDIDSALQNRRSKLCELGITMQPLIVAIKSDTTVTNIQVVIDHIRYSAFTVIKALDMLIKIIMSVDISYVVETRNFLLFLQLKSYNIRTKHDKMAPSVSTMLKRL